MNENDEFPAFEAAVAWVSNILAGIGFLSAMLAGVLIYVGVFR